MKRGHPLDRLACAAFAKHQRARYRAGQVAGSFSYHEWCCLQVGIATANKLAVLTKRRKDAERVPTMREIDSIATDEAREAARQYAALCRQVQANRNDPLLTGLY